MIAAITGTVAAHIFYANKVINQKSPLRLEVTSASLIDSRNDFLGTIDSPYTLVEIMDYQCPPCKKVHSKIPLILTRYKNKVRLTIRNFPLKIHKDAVPAAVAAEAAREQGKFWNMHNSLLESNQLDTAHINEIAHREHLDMKQFAHSINSTAKATVQSDIDKANELKLTGTPSFILCCPEGTVYQVFSLDQLATLVK